MDRLKSRRLRRVFTAQSPLAVLLFLAAHAYAAPDKIDADAEAVLAATGVPGAAVAIVRDGKIVSERAYGHASLAPAVPMRAEMALPIGSVSKQFTAALVLMLAEDGKLSLDDRVSKYLPELTRADEVTLRMLLQHTAGYQDDWPEDYSPPIFASPKSPHDIVDIWGRKPLDFDPGTQWQYSNTGYTIAALIAQQAGGAPFFDQLRARILGPLHMTSALDYDAHGLPAGAPVGYERHALGPLYPGPRTAPGWSFGAGMLAMTPHDLALWDISIIARALLKPASYAAWTTEAKLRDGHGTGYGLGVFVGAHGGHRFIEHSGEEVGFVSENVVFPDDRDAVVVLTNEDASRAARMIAADVARDAFGIDMAATSDKDAAEVLAILGDFAAGRIDRARFNDFANAYFTPAAVAEYRASLASLGRPLGIRERTHEGRGGMTFRAYTVEFATRSMSVTEYVTADGKLDQFLLIP